MHELAALLASYALQEENRDNQTLWEEACDPLSPAYATSHWVVDPQGWPVVKLLCCSPRTTDCSLLQPETGHPLAREWTRFGVGQSRGNASARPECVRILT